MQDPDPEDLRRHVRPALVTTMEDRRVFAADTTVKNNGWLRMKAWDGTTEYVPPHRIHKVQRVETEYYGERVEGEQSRRVADPERRRQARELVGDNAEKVIA
jgi:hypothetical protein